MKFPSLFLLLMVMLVAASCEKNQRSKIPQIGLTFFGARDGGNIVKVNHDTCFLRFTISDGDADLGNGLPSGKYDIFVKDFRFDTGYQGYIFPEMDDAILDPTKGISGECDFRFTPYILLPRLDSLHIAMGDTTHFEVYIKDKAGNESNHITTTDIIMVI